MLCLFLLYDAVNQPHVYMDPLPLGCPPSRSPQSTLCAVQQAPPAIYFARGS